MGPRPSVLIGLGIATLLAALSGLYFLQTRDITVSVLIGLIAVAVGVVGWVWEDAGRVGLPRVPWVLVVLLVPLLGLGAYLVAREIRRNGVETG